MSYLLVGGGPRGTGRAPQAGGHPEDRTTSRVLQHRLEHRPGVAWSRWLVGSSSTSTGRPVSTALARLSRSSSPPETGCPHGASTVSRPRSSRSSHGASPNLPSSFRHLPVGRLRCAQPQVRPQRGRKQDRLLGAPGQQAPDPLGRQGPARPCRRWSGSRRRGRRSAAGCRRPASCPRAARPGPRDRPARDELQVEPWNTSRPPPSG